jgi:hypothetical protein
MKHGIMISHKHSFYDYGINMVERKIGQPQKMTILNVYHIAISPTILT